MKRYQREVRRGAGRDGRPRLRRGGHPRRRDHARRRRTEGAKLRDAIAATRDFDGVTGKISIDENRNARKDAVVLKIEGGQFRFYRSVPAS